MKITSLRDFCDGDFDDPRWEFIEINLCALGLDESFLVDLFDITKTAIKHWKTGQTSIGIDKIPVLCELFGITVDQYYDGDSNNELHYNDFYHLSCFKDATSFTQFNFMALSTLFDCLNQATMEIECFPLGYIPVIEENGEESEEYFDLDDVEYFCQVLDINISYDTADGKHYEVESIKFDELCSISEVVKADWGQLSYKHIHAEYSKKYLRILLLSENDTFLRCFASDNEYEANEIKYELLELWTSLKKEMPEYDSNYMMAKTLLFCGATYLSEDGPDEKRTLQLCKEIIRHDIAEQNSKKTKEEILYGHK